MPPCPLLNCSGFLFCTGVYMEYDKPFKTYDEQIIKLRDEYGLVINDCNFATHALITMSYYDLVNGYKSVLMDSGKFKDNLPIEYLYELHLLDKSIQSFVMKYSLFVEKICLHTLLHHHSGLIILSILMLKIINHLVLVYLLPIMYYMKSCPS